MFTVWAGVAWITLPAWAAWGALRFVPLRNADLEGRMVGALSAGVCYFGALTLALQLAGACESVGLTDRLRPEISILALLLGGGTVWLAAKPRDRAEHVGAGELRDLFRFLRERPFLAVSCAAAAVSLLFFTAKRLAMWPSGHDSNLYHLPISLTWIQRGSIALDTADHWRYGMPGNGELAMLPWLTVGSIALSAVPSLAAALGLAVAVYIVAFRLQGSRTAALMAALTAMSVPIVQFHVGARYVDLYGAALLASGVALTVEYVARGGGPLRELAVAGLALGLGTGVKPTNYAYGAIAACGLIALISVSLRDRSRVARVAVLLIASAAPLSFWLLRGHVDAGNPFYPVEVRVGDLVVFPGWSPDQMSRTDWQEFIVDSPWEWWIHPWLERSTHPNRIFVPYSFDHGLGPTVATFVPLALVFALLHWARRRARPGLQTYLGHFLLFFVFAAGTLWATKMNVLMRFGLPLFAFASMLAAPLYRRLLESRSRAFRTVFATSISLGAFLTIIMPLVQVRGVAAAQRWSHSRFYGLPPAVEELPRGSVILNATSEYLNFPLFGKELTYRCIPNYSVPDEVTADYLAEQEIDIVVSWPYDHQLTRQLTAANAVPQRFDVDVAPGDRRSYILWSVASNPAAQ